MSVDLTNTNTFILQDFAILLFSVTVHFKQPGCDDLSYVSRILWIPQLGILIRKFMCSRAFL